MIASTISIHAGYDGGTVVAAMEHGYLSVTRKVAANDSRVQVQVSVWGNPDLVVEELRAMLSAAEGAIAGHGEPLPLPPDRPVSPGQVVSAARHRAEDALSRVEG